LYLLGQSARLDDFSSFQLVYLTLVSTLKHCNAPYVHKSFTKVESYSDFKHARSINGIEESGKLAFGPLTALVEHHINYNDPHFVKGQAVSDRPRILSELLGDNGTLFATDYSSFESSFSIQFLVASDIILLALVCINLIGIFLFFVYLLPQVAGFHYCIFRYYVMVVLGKRMSGDMWTSCANGFGNLCFTTAICAAYGYGLLGFFEGDDGIFRLVGLPDQSDYSIFRERFEVSSSLQSELEGFMDFATLYASNRGFTLKMESHSDVTTASFCGNVFHPNSMRVVTDPIKALLNFPWLDPKYAKSSTKVHMSLYRAKALSYLNQYMGCPLIDPFCRKVLDLTRGHTPVHYENSYHAKEIELALKNKIWNISSTIQLCDRVLVSEKFGVPIPFQLSFESMCLDAGDWKEIDLESIRFLLPKSVLTYSEDFIVCLDVFDCFHYQHHMPKSYNKFGPIVVT
jgi:hypothetical protein